METLNLIKNDPWLEPFEDAIKGRHQHVLDKEAELTAANAAARNSPSREKATLENPQIFQSCKSKNFISAIIARAKRRQF